MKGESVHLRAGDIVVIGDRPGQLPPAILERQPLLDLEHPNNQAGQAALAKIDDKARKADERARGARHHILDHLGTPPKPLPARHGIVG